MGRPRWQDQREMWGRGDLLCLPTRRLPTTTWATSSVQLTRRIRLLSRPTSGRVGVEQLALASFDLHAGPSSI